jgi:hypothetical protein
MSYIEEPDPLRVYIWAIRKVNALLTAALAAAMAEILKGERGEQY